MSCIAPNAGANSLLSKHMQCSHPISDYTSAVSVGQCNTCLGLLVYFTCSRLLLWYCELTCRAGVQSPGRQPHLLCEPGPLASQLQQLGWSDQYCTLHSALSGLVGPPAGAADFRHTAVQFIFQMFSCTSSCMKDRTNRSSLVDHSKDALH